MKQNCAGGVTRSIAAANAIPHAVSIKKKPATLNLTPSGAQRARMRAAKQGRNSPDLRVAR
jgi:hypothetical protein